VSETRYAPARGGVLAYQVHGAGPFDVVLAGGFPQHIELAAEQPGYRRLMERIAGFARLIVFDRRGMSLSDPPLPGDSLEDRAEDVLAVLAAAGSEHASFVSFGEGGLTVLQLAASHPEAVTSMVLVAPYPRLTAGDGYEHGLSAAAFAETVERARRVWGTGEWVTETLFPPMASDPVFRQWAGRFERYALSPTEAAEGWRRVGTLDVRALLPRITAPALLIGRSDNPGHGRGHVQHLATHLADARVRELPGEVVGTFFDADPEEAAEIQEFLVGTRVDPAPRRVVRAILFTDIVGSTDRAAQIGDGRWRTLLDHHDAVLAEEVGRHGGTTVKSTGDGVVAVFAAPSDAVRAATAGARRLADVGVDVRAGIHVGEVELRGADITGLAVHIAARVAALAGAREVLVSRTVADLLVGTEVALRACGAHELKGVPGRWELHAVAERG
jgi:class 3 adenylate cyclase